MRTSRAVALAFVVGSFFVAQEALTDLASGHPIDVAKDVVVVLRFWAVWALLTPAVLAAIRCWPLDVRPVYRPLIVHAVVAMILSVAHYVIILGVRSALSFSSGVSAREALIQHASLNAFVWDVFTGIFYYSVVVMVYTAVRFRGLYVAEQLSAAQLEAELTRSKLDTLQSQLRPHFLFNTLNAISVFVTEDADTAQQMILRLSTLLRRSLDEEAHEVPLRDEMGFVNDYLDIQRGRFGERLVIGLVVDPTVLAARVPVFLLQPLLENAIEHGKSDGGRMTIVLTVGREREAAGEPTSERLHITLVDDGPGVGNGVALREGIGLSNTRARLHHLYGSRAAVALSAGNGTAASPGTRVEIWLPFAESAG